LSFLREVLGYWQHDWIHNRRLFWLELAGVICNIGASLVMAATAPQCPLLPLYGVWLVGSMLMTYTSYQRRTSFMLLLMSTYMAINAIGLANSLR
jgi:hypothetical protein